MTARCGCLLPFTMGYNHSTLMSRPAGTRLGPYEIVAAIGAGGMGEVYRARDGRLGRDLARQVGCENF
jgi:serine/threonine protein kinase